MAITIQTIEIPDIWLARSANRTDALRTMVSEALKNGLVPIIPEKTTGGLTINLHPAVLAKVTVVAEKHSMTIPAAFTALAAAGLKYLTDQSRREQRAIRGAQGEIDEFLLLRENQIPRAEQLSFWRGLAGGLMHDKVVLAEASTGVGKGKCIASAAVMAVKKGKVPVLVAAPTLQVLAQLWQEYVGYPQVSGIKAAFLPGRQEFVDDVLLRDYLAKYPSPAVQEWVDAGAPNRVATTLSSHCAESGIELSWLTADLHAVADGDLRSEDFVITDNTPPTSQGMEMLNALKERAAEADVVFLTHTMLCYAGARGYWSMLPRVKEAGAEGERVNSPVIIIDEAHLFEEQMANTVSDNISLFSLRYRINRAIRESGVGKGAALSTAAKLVNDLMNLCRSASNDGETITLRSGTFNAKELPENAKNLCPAIASIAKELHAALNKKRGSVAKVIGVQADIDALVRLMKSLSGLAENRVALIYSPHREFPLISVGPSSVSPNLRALWDAAGGGVALVSATLWLPSWQGTFRVNYMRDLLAVPLSRSAVPDPVVWKEMYSPVKYMFPPELAAELAPPPSTAPDVMTRWCDTQAKLIASFNSNCPGGTLVLCTSYDQVATLSASMVNCGVDPERLVINTGKLAEDQKAFAKKHDKGLRPIWLVLGPGWTGLDLIQRSSRTKAPVPPEKDTLLSDLVITRIPFGLNRSETMRARVEQNFKATAYDALLRLKQGLGRLIRRERLQNRRILVLDGRLGLTTSSPFMLQAAKDALLVLSKYQKKIVFKG